MTPTALNVADVRSAKEQADDKRSEDAGEDIELATADDNANSNAAAKRRQE